MGQLKDCKVYHLECNSCLHGLWSGWVDITPDRRYSCDELMDFQDNLTIDDTFGLRWRGRMMKEFGKDVVPLKLQPGAGVEEPPFRHVHTCMAPGECLPPVGWDLLVGTLTHKLNSLENPNGTAL